MALEFADLEKLPDDVKIALPDGKEITLGEIRGVALDHVNKRIADLTPREQKLVTREKQVAEQERMVRESIAALANTPPPPPNNQGPVPPVGTPSAPLGYTNEQWQAIQNDAYSRPLVNALAALAEKAEKLEKMVQDNELTRQQREEAARQKQEVDWINHQLDLLASRDEQYKDPANRQALLDFAKETLTRRDLTVLDKARNYDTRIKAAQDEAYQRGLKEGQAKPVVPSVPYGTRSVPAPPPPEKLPSTFNEFVDSAANDTSLIQEIREAASSPNPPQ